MNATANETIVGEEASPTGRAGGVSRLGIPGLDTKAEDPSAQIQQTRFSDYILDPIRKDEEVVISRGKDPGRTDAPSVLLVSTVSKQPSPGTLKKLENEYSLKDELNSAWAVRPLALSQESGQATLVLEDPGGKTLDRLPPGPMEMGQFLCSAGLATALSGHKSGLIHRDIKAGQCSRYSATPACSDLYGAFTVESPAIAPPH